MKFDFKSIALIVCYILALYGVIILICKIMSSDKNKKWFSENYRYNIVDSPYYQIASEELINSSCSEINNSDICKSILNILGPAYINTLQNIITNISTVRLPGMGRMCNVFLNNSSTPEYTRKQCLVYTLTQKYNNESNESEKNKLRDIINLLANQIDMPNLMV